MLNLALIYPIVDGTVVHYVSNNELMVFIFVSLIQLQKNLFLYDMSVNTD